MRVRGRRPHKFFLCVKAYILVLDIIHSVGLCPSGLKYLGGQIDNITHAIQTGCICNQFYHSKQLWNELEVESKRNFKDIYMLLLAC